MGFVAAYRGASVVACCPVENAIVARLTHSSIVRQGILSGLGSLLSLYHVFAKSGQASPAIRSGKSAV